MPRIDVQGGPPSQQQKQDALTQAALDYLATLPPATHDFGQLYDQNVKRVSGGSSGGGGGGGSSAPSVDFGQVGLDSIKLTFPGLPDDVAKQVYGIFKNGGSADQAIAYIRSTDWHKQTYPGFEQGFNLGLIGNEGDYRTYSNAINQLYKQFYNRDVLKPEVASFLGQGLDPGLVQRQLQAHALLGTFSDPIKGIFSNDELQQIANNEVGLGTPNGAKLDALARLATSLNTIYRQFTGSNISRSQLEGAFNQGLDADTVEKQFRALKFIDANRGDIQYALGNFGPGRLSENDLLQYGQSKVGLGSQIGDRVDAQIQKALERMQGVFKGQLATLGGSGLSRRLTQATSPDVGA